MRRDGHAQIRVCVRARARACVYAGFRLGDSDFPARAGRSDSYSESTLLTLTMRHIPSLAVKDTESVIPKRIKFRSKENQVQVLGRRKRPARPLIISRSRKDRDNFNLDRMSNLNLQDPSTVKSVRKEEALARDVLISRMQSDIDEIKHRIHLSKENFRDALERQKLYTRELKSRLSEGRDQIASFKASIPPEMLASVRDLLEEPSSSARDLTQNRKLPPTVGKTGFIPDDAVRTRQTHAFLPRSNNKARIRPHSGHSTANENGHSSPERTSDAVPKAEGGRPESLNPRHEHETKPTSPVPTKRPGRRGSALPVEPESFQNNWLPSYALLLESLYAPSGGAGGAGGHSEAAKIREKVRVEVERLMAAADRPSKALVAMVDAAEQGARTAWLDEVAVHFRAVGMLLRVMHAMRTLSGAVLDAGSAYALFLAEARKLVAADEAQARRSSPR